jgi:hypothetical protein
MNCPKCGCSTTITKVTKPGITMSGLLPICKACFENTGAFQVVATQKEVEDWVAEGDARKKHMVTGQIQNDKQLKEIEAIASGLLAQLVTKSAELHLVATIFNQLSEQVRDYEPGQNDPRKT